MAIRALLNEFSAVEKQMKTYHIPPNPAVERLFRIAPLRPIRNRKEYRSYLSLLGFCMRTVEHAEYSKSILQAVGDYLDILNAFIGEYEKKTFTLPKTTQAGLLEFLMDQHKLSQSDLAKDLGGQPAVSNVLRGKRTLNVRQISKLSKRFGLSPATFFTDK